MPRAKTVYFEIGVRLPARAFPGSQLNSLTAALKVKSPQRLGRGLGKGLGVGLGEGLGEGLGRGLGRGLGKGWEGLG
jgi:hypothetical protein